MGCGFSDLSLPGGIGCGLSALGASDPACAAVEQSRVHSGKTTKQANNTVLRMVVLILSSSGLQAVIAGMAPGRLQAANA
jgi:hypothetical protein